MATSWNRILIICSVWIVAGAQELCAVDNDYEWCDYGCCTNSCCNMSTLAIVGMVIGVIMAVLSLVCCIICIVCLCNKHNSRRNGQVVQQQPAQNAVYVTNGPYGQQPPPYSNYGGYPPYSQPANQSFDATRGVTRGGANNQPLYNNAHNDPVYPPGVIGQQGGSQPPPAYNYTNATNTPKPKT